MENQIIVESWDEVLNGGELNEFLAMCKKPDETDVTALGRFIMERYESPIRKNLHDNSIENENEENIYKSKSYKLVNDIVVTVNIHFPCEMEYRIFIKTENMGILQQFYFMNNGKFMLTPEEVEVTKQKSLKFFNEFNREMALEWYLKHLSDKIKKIAE